MQCPYLLHIKFVFTMLVNFVSVMGLCTMRMCVLGGFSTCQGFFSFDGKASYNFS